MRFPAYLAIQNLLRNPGRNILYILGISITAALLLDMILLSGGLSISIEKILNNMGYEIRISPRGTLPFETDAQILQFTKLRLQIESMPEVERVDAMLGTNVQLRWKNQMIPCFALGLKIERPVLYRVEAGTDLNPGSNEILVNSYLAQDQGIRPGDILKIQMPQRTQVIQTDESVSLKVAGIAHFYLDAEGQYSFALPIHLLQQLLKQETADPVSAILVRIRDSSKASEITQRINQQFPQLSAYTINSVIQAVDLQMSYFKQFAYILGGISLIVTFVLVFIITTVSFHDRIGEIALLRAIGLSHRTIFTTILFEGILTSLIAALFGSILGKFVALYLDMILTAAPGLPEGFSFFVLQPSAILRAAITLLTTGFFAGLYPALAAVRLPVAQTLREEIL